MCIRDSFIELDANSKLGSNIIPGDPCQQPSENGKLLLELLEQHPNLTLLNKTNLCEGTITRSRTANNMLEESVIDFVMISDDLIPLVQSMLIYEDRKHSLTRFRKLKH